jgi:hypothetical protein
MSAATPSSRVPWLLQAPGIRDLHAPRWVRRRPTWLVTAVVLAVLLAVSAALRARFITGQLWGDEATAVGIASHPLTAIPGLLRHDGSAPLYYLLLHVWISVFGSSEPAAHMLSILLGLLSVPVALGGAWCLFGRRAGMAAGVLFAFSPFLTQYAEEMQPYELLALLGLLSTLCFLHAFIHGRRPFLIGFAVSLPLLLYTSFWAIFFWIATAVALLFLARGSPEPRRLLRDGGVAYLAALVLFLPWVPNLLFQMSHTTSPWGYGDHPGFGFPSSLLGSDRVTVSLAIAAVVGLLPLALPARRRTPEARMIGALLMIAVVAALLARATTLVSPVWETRYLATVLAALLLVGAVACARSGVIGLIALVLTLAFAANTASFAPQYKSDMRDVAGELAPYLHSGDLVLMGQPDQSPLAWYYLPAGLRFATTMGPVSDPSYMNWAGAYSRLQSTDPRRNVQALVATLRPGQHLLYARPLTEGVKAWSASWADLVRRRAAQTGAILASDPALRPIVFAPHNYRSACCVADSATVYAKRG